MKVLFSVLLVLLSCSYVLSACGTSPFDQKTGLTSIAPAAGVDTLIINIGLSSNDITFTPIWMENVGKTTVDGSVSACTTTVAFYPNITISNGVSNQLVVNIGNGTNGTIAIPTTMMPSTTLAPNTTTTTPGAGFYSTSTTNPLSTTTTTTAPTTTKAPTSPNASPRMAPNFLMALFIVFFAIFVPKNRWSAAILVIAVVLIMSASSSPNTSNASMAASITANATVFIPQSINAFCYRYQGGALTCVYRNSTGTVGQNYFNVDGRRYASLNEVLGQTCSQVLATNGGLQTIPAGWTLVPSPLDARGQLAVNLYYNFAVGILVYAGSVAYTPNSVSPSTAPLQDNSGGYVTTVGANQVQYKTCSTPVTVLIYQEFGITEVTAGKALFDIPRPTNFVTFGGYDYASGDNSAFSLSTATASTVPGLSTTGPSAGCQYNYLWFNPQMTNWAIAPNEDRTWVAVSYTGIPAIAFGATCYVMTDPTAGSVSYGPTELACNAVASGAPFIQSVTYNGGTISRSECTSDPRKLIIRRVSPATSVARATTYAVGSDRVISYSNTVGGATSYATIDFGNIANACQGTYLALAAGAQLFGATLQIATQAALTTLLSNSFNPSTFLAPSSRTNTALNTYCFGSTNVVLSQVVTGGVIQPPQQCSPRNATLMRTVDGVTYYNTPTCGKIVVFIGSGVNPTTAPGQTTTSAPAGSTTTTTAPTGSTTTAAPGATTTTSAPTTTTTTAPTTTTKAPTTTTTTKAPTTTTTTTAPTTSTTAPPTTSTQPPTTV